MVGFIITGYGNFASGLYSACKLLSGEYSNVEIVDFIDGDSIDDLDFKINNAINSLCNYEKKKCIYKFKTGSVMYSKEAYEYRI